VHDFGLAIIILTIIIRGALWPLVTRQLHSQRAIQELQPALKRIKAEAKGDKQKEAQMTMELYKEKEISPFASILPLLIQLPIFWGVFRMLVASVEFRHAPFALWVRDLSVMDPTYVTPILMGATQFISQKMTPTSADPAQAKMMLIMPVMMTVFFITFPSGLVLYWLTTNVLQIAQQAIMNKMMARQKRESDGKRRP